MSPLVAPPLTTGKNAPDQQRAYDFDLFYSKALLPEVLRFELAVVNAPVVPDLVRIPYKAGAITLVRVYAHTAGSGVLTFDVFFTNPAGTLFSVWNAPIDQISTGIGSPALVEKVPTAALVSFDPRDNAAGRIGMSVTGYTGAGNWLDVVVEVIVTPIARS